MVPSTETEAKLIEGLLDAALKAGDAKFAYENAKIRVNMGEEDEMWRESQAWRAAEAHMLEVAGKLVDLYVSRKIVAPQ